MGERYEGICLLHNFEHENNQFSLSVKAITHDQVNLTSMLRQVTCSSELDRVYGETW